MANISRILCPVDFSDASKHALDHAIAIARWYGARITALHVRQEIVLLPPTLLAEIGNTTAAPNHEAERRLHEWLAPVRDAGLTADIVLRDGSNPAAHVVAVADETNTNLVVMGTHGRSGFDRLVLGSVTEKVIRKTRRPVLTVPPPAIATSTLPFKRVLCGIDFSAPSVEALRFASSIAKASDSTLTLLHVMEYPFENESVRTLPFDSAGYRTAVKEDAAKRLEALASDELREWRSPQTKLAHGKPYEQILATAAADGADLIVLGVHGRPAFDVMLFGSTTSQVIRRATCPVLTLNR
jgi:nucleotide-binding universal stress UspA family protein